MKSLVRKMALTLAVVLCAVLSYAQQAASEPKYSFVVWFHDGGKVSLLMDEHPVVTYSDGNIVVSTSKEQLTYAHVDVRKFTLADEDISQGETTEIETSKCKAQWQCQGDVMCFADCIPSESVTVYNTTGLVVVQYSISADGTLQIPLSQLGEGIYIIKIGSITYKFMKK